MKEFGCAAFNPSGESVVIGSCNYFFTYAYYPRTREWRLIVFLRHVAPLPTSPHVRMFGCMCSGQLAASDGVPSGIVAS